MLAACSTPISQYFVTRMTQTNLDSEPIPNCSPNFVARNFDILFRTIPNFERQFHRPLTFITTLLSLSVMYWSKSNLNHLVYIDFYTAGFQLRKCISLFSRGNQSPITKICWWSSQSFVSRSQREFTPKLFTTIILLQIILVLHLYDLFLLRYCCCTVCFSSAYGDADISYSSSMSILLVLRMQFSFNVFIMMLALPVIRSLHCHVFSHTS